MSKTHLRVNNHRSLRFVPEKRDCKGTHNFLFHKRFADDFLEYYYLMWWFESAVMQKNSFQHAKKVAWLKSVLFLYLFCFQSGEFLD